MSSNVRVVNGFVWCLLPLLGLPEVEDAFVEDLIHLNAITIGTVSLCIYIRRKGFDAHISVHGLP